MNNKEQILGLCEDLRGKVREIERAQNEIPQELLALGCFIKGGEMRCPRENAAKVQTIIRRMNDEWSRSHPRPARKPIMVGMVPKKRV